MRQKVCWKTRTSILTFLKVFKFTVTKRVTCVYVITSQTSQYLSPRYNASKKNKKKHAERFRINLMFLCLFSLCKHKEKNAIFHILMLMFISAYTGNFFSKSLEIVWKSNFIILIAISILCSMEIIRIHYGFSDTIANFIVWISLCFSSIYKKSIRFIPLMLGLLMTRL